MACITKLASAIDYDCDTGATGLVSAIIINRSDLASFTVSESGFVSGVTLVSGAKVHKIDTVKRSLVMSASLKVNDGAPNAYTHTATIVDTGDREGNTGRDRARALTNGSFVIITKPVGKVYGAVFGLYFGLSATSSDFSTHDNGGWTTTVLSTPENVIGEDSLVMLGTDYDALYGEAV